MHGIPTHVDLSHTIGQCTTQIRVGEFEVQFEIGPVHFAIYSPIELLCDGRVVGSWKEGEWPDRAFLEVLNVNVAKWAVPNERVILITFENGIAMRLVDSSEQYESMVIGIEGEPGPWII